MALKYKLGDVVVLGENVDSDYGKYFTPGVKVRIDRLHDNNHLDEHYTVYRVGGKGGKWWVYDDEINHKATEELRESNESGDIVGKTEAVSDDNAKEVRTPALEDNAPQTAPQNTVEDSYSTVYSSVSVFRKGSVKEGDSVFCSEGSTTISIIEDDVKFLVFHQDGREIYLDFDEVDAVFSAAKKLMLQYNHAG